MNRIVLMAVLAGVLFGAPVLAQTPWGGDDEGYIPPDKPTATCENAVEKALAKALACIAKCHQMRATGKLVDDVAEENCETNTDNPASCKSKFDTAKRKLISLQICPACLDEPTMEQVFGLGQAFLDGSVNGQIYCGQ